MDVLVEPQGVWAFPLAQPPALPPDAMVAMARPVRPAPRPASTATAVTAWAFCIPAGLPAANGPTASAAYVLGTNRAVAIRTAQNIRIRNAPSAPGRLTDQSKKRSWYGEAKKPSRQSINGMRGRLLTQNGRSRPHSRSSHMSNCRSGRWQFRVWKRINSIRREPEGVDHRGFGARGNPVARIATVACHLS